MRTRIIVAVIALAVAAGLFFLKFKTRIDWNDMQSVEVYTDSALGRNFEKMKDVNLDGMAHYNLNADRVRQVFSKAKTELQVLTVWKEYRYAVAHFKNSKPLRLKISPDGGFFFVLNYGRKYEIKKEDMEEWEKIWTTR